MGHGESAREGGDVRFGSGRRCRAADGAGRTLPHAYGWFVQQYNNEKIVWQFGVSDNASSSMILILPRRGLTLILLANSQGLARPFALSAGDVTVSPFARLFLSIFAR